MIPHDTRNVCGMMCVTFGKTAHASHDTRNVRGMVCGKAAHASHNIPSPYDEACAERSAVRAFIVTANRPFPQAVSTVS